MYVYFDVGPLIIAHHSMIYINIIYKNQFAKFNCSIMHINNIISTKPSIDVSIELLEK